MTNTSHFPFPVLRRPVAIVLVDRTLGHQYDSSYINPLVQCLKKGNYSQLPAQIEYVVYDQVSLSSIDPAYPVGGHDEEGMINEDIPGIDDFRGYMSVIKIIDDLRMSHHGSNEELSFFVWHVAASQHGSWDHNWQRVRSELKSRKVNLSMILLGHCPKFTRLFISMSSPPIEPWFHTFPHLTYLLSGFTPSGELEVAVPPMVSAGHHASSGFAPPTIDDAMLESLHELPAHETQYPNDQLSEPPIPQHPGCDIFPHVPETDPFPCGSPPPFGSAVVPNQPNFNYSDIPDIQEPAPMLSPVPPHGRPHDYTMKVDAGDNCADARSMSSGASDKKSNNEWTGQIKLHDTCVPAKAVSAATVGDLKLSTFPDELEAKPNDGDTVSTVDIQGWARENKVSMSQLSCGDEKDNSDFDQLLKTIRPHGYAIVTWKDRERLLLAPLAKVLLCAAFPEDKDLKRPTRQPLRPVRVITNRKPRKKKENFEGKKTSTKKENSRNKGKPQRRSRPQPRSRPTPTPKSPRELYLAEALQNTIPPQPRDARPEQPPMPCHPQGAMEPTQGDFDPSGYYHHQMESAQYQTPSPRPPLEQQAYPQQLQWGGTFVDENNQLVSHGGWE